MINPSTYGWIEKFFNKNENQFIDYSEDYENFYTDLRNSGFIYGYTVNIPLKKSINTVGLSQDEITKIALLNALYNVYRIVKKIMTLIYLFLRLKVFTNPFKEKIIIF